MMRALIATVAAFCAALAAGCSTPITAGVPRTTDAPTPPANEKSQIVAAMENSYEERPELPVDPCQDTFIATMETLGYQLQQSVEPNTNYSYGFWHTSCIFRGETTGMSLSATNSPNLAAQLKPGDGAFLDAYPITIGDRFAVVSPSIDYERHCWIGVETSFGAINASGGTIGSLESDGRDACREMTEFLEQLDPLLGD